MKKYILSIFIVLWWSNCFSAQCPGTIPQGETASCDIITQYGITWTLGAEETVGQFITGDYFIVYDGSVTVSSVSPAPTGTGTALRNGSMINPYSRGVVAHDGRIPGFNDTYNVSFPVDMSINQSLVSVESHTDGLAHLTVLGENAAPEHTPLKSAAVLTVLQTQPPSGSFRPAISDSTKKLYNWDDVRFDKIPYVAVPAGSMVHTVETYKRAFKRPWLLYHYGYYNRYLGPTQNQGNYHEYINRALNELSALLMTNTPDHAELLRGYLQTGIDMYAAIHTATAGYNRKNNRALIVATSVLLDDPEIASFSPSIYRENYQPYYGEGWYGQTVLWSQVGTANFEETQPTEWDTVAISANCGCKNEQYRRDTFVRQWVGGYLSAKLLGVDDATWGSSAFFDLVERWFDEEGAEDAARVNYLVEVCTAPQDNGCAKMGVFPAAGSTVSAFSRGMWDNYKNYNITRRLFRNVRIGEVEP